MWIAVCQRNSIVHAIFSLITLTSGHFPDKLRFFPCQNLLMEHAKIFREVQNSAILQNCRLVTLVSL